MEKNWQKWGWNRGDDTCLFYQRKRKKKKEGDEGT
jgi:hypothetical protein